MDVASSNPAVLVCQHGARHRYAIPRMLEQKGLLAGLYTDSSAHSFCGKVASVARGCAPESLQHLTGRKIIGIPDSKIHSFDTPLIQSLIHRSSMQRKSLLDQQIQYGDWLASRLIRKGTLNASHIYSMNRSNLSFVEYAKSTGCRSIIDVFISPATDRVVLEESQRFPEWGREFPADVLSKGAALWKKMISLADLLLCPSAWVAEGVCEVDPVAERKIRIVPYGCSIDYQNRRNEPVKGRVLFVGGDALRKGLMYLAEAAERLYRTVPELEIRIAGKLPSSVSTHPAVGSMRFLGKLNAEQIKEEYLSADVFVLPSLSEGFASVVAEAVGSGCPVIVTRETGSPIVHGREGLTVPSKNSGALAEAIWQMITDRAFRMRCSAACIEQAGFYTEDAWASRLLHAMEVVSCV